MRDEPAARLREICMAFPETTEKLSHGAPTWFVRDKRTFATYAGRHHGDREAFWCAGAPGAQEALVQSEPERFFCPPYVGPRGWIGVWLDVPLDWDEIAGLVAEAYAVVAPKVLGMKSRLRYP